MKLCSVHLKAFLRPFKKSALEMKYKMTSIWGSIQKGLIILTDFEDS